MSTRLYCDQCGRETRENEALRFSLSGYSRNRNYMSQTNTIDIDICPDCAHKYDEQDIGIIHVHRDFRSKLSPYQLEYQPLTTKEQA